MSESEMPNILFFDTETTGLYDFSLPPDHPSQPHLVQLACVLEDSERGIPRATIELLVKPDDWTISEEVARIHGIDEDTAKRYGVTRKTAAFLFNNLCYQADLLVAHNINFDTNVMKALFARTQLANKLGRINKFCTMQTATPIVKRPHKNGKGKPGTYKWPTLTECMDFFFGEAHDHAHNALADVEACRRVYYALQGYVEAA